MSRRKSVQPRQSVGITKREEQALAKFDKLIAEHNSHLSGQWSEQEMGRIFAKSFTYILRDDWIGSKLFDMPDLERVLHLLFRSAGIQATNKDIRIIEKQLAQLIPEMTGLIDRLLIYKTVLRFTPIFEHIDTLFPDRFLAAVYTSFHGNKPLPEFFTAQTEFDPMKHKTTDFTNLLWINGK